MKSHLKFLEVYNGKNFHLLMPIELSQIQLINANFQDILRMTQDSKRFTALV